MKNAFFKLINVQSLYVLVVVLTSSIGFLRSYLFMRWLNMEELGMISLVQTIVLFLSLFQFGLINGGYRLFVLNEVKEQSKVNNILFSYFGLLTILFTVLWLVLWVTNKTIVVNNCLLLAGLVSGVFTLINNWLTNTLIGKRLIKEISIINVVSAFISVLSLWLVFIWGIVGAVIALIVQPFMFVVITLAKQPNLRPTAWNFDLAQIRYILSFGFIPFLAGIFVLVNLQIERWSIAEILGVGALGEYYLVFLYATLFVLVPTSLLNLFFPKAICAYENRNMPHFYGIMKKYLLILSIYLLLLVLGTILGLQFFVDLLLPMHSENTIYVYYFLPGLVALVLCDPLAIVFNSCVKLKPLLYAGLVSVMFNILAIYIINKLACFTLMNMTFVKVSINVIILAIYFFYATAKRKTIFCYK